MTNDEQYMHRCLELAQKGLGYTAPNPLVGAVLVYNDQVIGEGYHEQFGGPHAEPNCIHSVKEEDKKNIPSATLYVSLEPCAHFGKTPPCTDLIIEQKIPRVVIGCQDPFKQVNGAGIEKLLSANINVRMGVLENECKEVNKRFFTSHAKQQPYIILKWAETANGIMGHCNGKRLTISNEYTNRLVHKWRSEEMAILVGTNTALQDDPILTNRYWPGPSPIRIVLDRNLRLPKTLQIFQGQKTIVLTDSINETRDTVRYIKLSEGISVPHQLANTLFQQNIQSVLIEGGAQLLQSFIDSELWNEARVIINKELFVENGVAAPTLQHAVLAGQQTLFSDNISFYKKHS